MSTGSKIKKAVNRTTERESAVRDITRVVAYVRVSTEQQADDGHSLEAQRVRLEAYAVSRDLQIVAFEEDAGVPASSLERPGLKRALAYLDTFQAEGLLVIKLDRLTRRVKDLGALIDTYFKDGQHSLISVGESIDTASAGGRLVLNVLTAVSQWEVEAIGERTRAVMQHLKAEGRHTGGPAPFGYRVAEGGYLKEVPAEQLVIQKARHLRSLGHTLRAIASHLVNPRTGKEFQHTQIVRML